MTENDQADQTNDPQAAADDAYNEATEGQENDSGDQGAEKDSGAQGTGTDSEVSKLRKEAARYRTSLRKVEAERDQLAARMSDYDRAEVERQLGEVGGLQNPGDFWLTGVQLEDLLGEDGGLDSEKVKAARDKVIEEHPHWRKPAADFDQGAREPANEKRFSFGEALKKEASG